MAVAHPVGEGCEGRTQPLLVGLAQRHERAASTLHVERGDTAEEDNVSTRNASRPRTCTAWPRKCGTVRLGGVRSGEHQGVVAGAAAELAQPFHRACESELGAAQALDEVAAPAG